MSKPKALHPAGTLPNGHGLWWEYNEVGGRTYWSDEIGGGLMVWDTALVEQSTLLAAIVEEERLRIKEFYEKKLCKLKHTK
jgi:hypothetical protein